MDTNILHKSSFNDYNEFKLNRLYEDLQGKIELTDVERSFQILIPDIVFNELHQQQLQEFKKDLNQLKSLNNKFKNLRNFTIELPENVDYSELLQQLISEFKSRNTIYTIDIHTEKSVFENIIDKALRKLPPFEGKSKQSDKGFKDALIWEFLLYHASMNPGNYYFLTSDKIFNDESSKKSLTDEFKSFNPDSSINFIKSKEEAIQQIEKFSGEQSNLRRKIEIDEQLQPLLPNLETQVVEEIFKDFTVNNITNYTYDSIDFIDTSTYLSEINNISYEFSLGCILDAVKPSSKISMNLLLTFVLTTVSSNDTDIRLIEMDSIDASTLDGDDLEIITKPFKLEFSPIVDDTPEKKNTQKETTIKSGPKIPKKNEVQRSLTNIDKQAVNDILQFHKIKFDTLQYQELYTAIAEHLTIDWMNFENKVKSIRLGIKKILSRHGINNHLSIADEIIEKLENNYK
ncbi:PIN domain-containing protein [Staphylococcus delphini]|uniref:PIN domain-containing protein n=1 Tax=Staphylococcus delphini TaxID=53344 RepID=UPI0023B2D374|nr:PIN domain-containing protein [Staphylococcus delphini]MDE9793712.1 PIN domain-containing protein [Staphylococcus delphini]